MTQTEELRALLEGRGVEYTVSDGEHVEETCWPYMGELMAVFAEYDNGTTRFACDTWCFTPAQAVDATLGRGTCHDKGGIGTKFPAVFICSACKWYSTMFAFGDGMPCYCPNCGRKVEG